jgi:hypothetical protein
MGQQKHAHIDWLIQQSRCKYCGEAAPDCTCDHGRKKKIISFFKWMVTAMALASAGTFITGSFLGETTPAGGPAWAYWPLGFVVALATLYWTTWCIARGVGENLEDMEK